MAWRRRPPPAHLVRYRISAIVLSLLLTITIRSL
jgi:hypothetical protein